MANTIKLKNSGTSTNVPSSLEHGELAINYADGKIFYKDSTNTIVHVKDVAISDAAPSSPVEGDMWFESDTADFHIYYDGAWVDVGGSSVANISIGSSPPTSTPVNGDLWFDSDTAKTYIYYNDGTSSQWIEVGAVSAAASGTDGAIQFASGGTFSSDASNLVWDDTNNRLGIGTTAPDTTLHIEASQSISNVIRAGNGTTYFDNYINDVNGEVRLSAIDPTGNNNSKFMTFATSPSGGSATERVRINSSGNVGIGTTTPDVPLHVDGDAGNNEIAKLQSSQTSATYSLVGITDANETAKAFIGFNPGASLNNTDSYLMLGMNGDDVNGGNGLIVRKGGNVGIGTNSPTARLDVNGETQASYVTLDRGGISLSQPAIDVEANGVGAGDYNYFFRAWNDTGAKAAMFVNGSTRSADGGANTMTIRNDGGGSRFGNGSYLTTVTGNNVHLSGMVGIGTTTPSAQLTVKAASTGLDDGTVEFHSWSGSPTSPTEVEDWPTPVLALRAYDNFYVQSMLSFGYPQDAIYQTGNPVWAFRLRSGNNQTVSTSSTNLEIIGPGTFEINCALSKPSGSFKIPHPLPDLSETHDLVHSFVEAPQADNIYRGKSTLVNGVATVNLDSVAGMTEGTFILLNRNIQCFTSNEQGWTAVRGKVDGNLLTIEAQDASCGDTVSWLVVGERHDKHMYDTNWTDDEGRVIVEPLTNRVSEAAIAESVARMEAARIEALEAN